MSEDQTRDTSEIDTLLADRQQLQDWLARLEAADAPEPVRHRVRADYEGRLAEVVVRLGSFSDTLSGSLAEQRARLDEVESQKGDASEERAEAQLRHQVGEYTDEEWKKLDATSGTRLEGFDAEIEDLSAEIGRLDEVLSQIVPSEPSVMDEDLSDLDVRPLPDGDEPGIRESSDATGDAQDLEGEGEPRLAEAPRFTPKGGEARRESAGGGGATRTLRFPTPAPGEETGGGTEGEVDEMTFIKSVTLDTGETEDAQGQTRGGNSKTLKCADCGSMNRPTEWYCERCGAELAAL